GKDGKSVLHLGREHPGLLAGSPQEVLVKPKTLILIVSAFVTGVIAGSVLGFLLAIGWAAHAIGREISRPEENPPETRTILVTKKPISQWTVIRTPEEMFEEKGVPVGGVPPTAVTKMDDL